MWRPTLVPLITGSGAMVHIYRFNQKRLYENICYPLIGELIISGSKFGVSEVRESIFASRMSLTVHNFEKFDIGKYRCIAKNSLGEVEGRIHVYGITSIILHKL